MIDIVLETKLISNYIKNLRKYFHMHAELSMQEYETSKKIKEELDKINVPYLNEVETEVIASIGNNKGKTIALRCDMDGLKISENTGVPYTSINKGIMHACGHDAHISSLIGAAIILKKYEDMLPGKVIFIFQPSEENAKGAKLICEHGYLDNVDEIFGLHVFTDIDCGKISIESGARMAASDKFFINIKGKAGHAGSPHQCIDASLVCAALLMNLQSIVSREISPLDNAVVTVGHIESGSTHNIISSKAFIEGTVRTFSVSTANHIKASIERISYATALSYGAKVDIEYESSSHPAVINDINVVNTAINGAKKIFKDDAFIKTPPIMLGEDFAIYQKKIPGAFAFIGSGNDEIGCVHPNHSEKFNIDEKSVVIATQLYLAYALEALSKT
ncbi:MAG: amidohydrolase [Clostridium sp.]|nr:amidohydrolase [Clostridium sp.]